MHFGGRDQMQGFQVRPYGDLRHGLGHQPEPIDMFPGYASAKSAGVTEIPESLLQDVVVTRESLSFLLEHSDEHPQTPWFLCASYARPHPPFTAPGRYIGHCQGKVPPTGVKPGIEAKLEPFALRHFQRTRDLTAEDFLRGREGYYACVDFVDDCIGQLLDALQEAGLLENTIVIYTSDHGEMLGSHGLWSKNVYYEPAIAVPLLISDPGISRGSHRVQHPISLMDLFPTTCSLVGIPIPDDLDGIDFSSVLANPEAESPRSFAPSASYLYGTRFYQGKPVSVQETHSAMRLIRDHRWKYVEIQGGDPLLFDLENDPDEELNLARDEDHTERRQQLRDALFRNFSWSDVHEQLEQDWRRLPEFSSGLKPTTPNQYMLPDGRIFDAEGDLYGARWLFIPPGSTGGIIPQRFG